MSGRGTSWPVGYGVGGDAGNRGDHGHRGHRDIRGDSGGALVEADGAVGGTPLVGAIYGEKGVGDSGNGIEADATARAQALVQAARFRSDASVVAGLAEKYKDEVVRAWLFGAADRRTPARNLAAEGLLFTAAYQDTASGRQSQSSEVALVQVHKPPYVLGTIVDAGGPHPVASVGSHLTGVPFGATTVRRRWAVDLSSPILEVVEAAVTDTGGLIVVERGVIPTCDGAPTLHEAIRFYSASRVGLAASVEGGGRPTLGTGILQILRLAGYSHPPPPAESSTARACDKPDTPEEEGRAGRHGHTSGAPAQRISGQTPSATGGTTETDSSGKTGGSSRSGSAHGSGGSQSRPAKDSPCRLPPPPPAFAEVGGQEARPAVPLAPVGAPRGKAGPPATPAAPTVTGGNTMRPKRPRNFGCVSCEACFLSASDRDRHVNTVHHRRRDWPCDKCDFRGLQRAHLKTHVAARHGGERRFVCPHCNDGVGCTAYRSISRSAVERHVRRVHQQLRPFTCTAECGATFAARSDLTRHKLRRHSGAEAGAEEGNGAAAGSTKAPPAA
ncbi:hypothetical protein MMPV_000116 [Pyropia vietnamensis]